MPLLSLLDFYRKQENNHPMSTSSPKKSSATRCALGNGFSFTCE